MLTQSGCRHLAIAIVQATVDDWKKANAVCEQIPDNRIAHCEKKELEEFFQSEWYQTLRAFAEDVIPTDMMEVLENDK